MSHELQKALFPCPEVKAFCNYSGSHTALNEWEGRA